MVKPVDKTENFIDPTEYYVVPDVEDLDFEKLESEMGKMLIFVTSDRRKYQHLRSETLDKEYKERVQDHAASLRNVGQLVFLFVENGLRCVDLSVDVAPQVFPALENIFNNFTGSRLNFVATFFSQENSSKKVKEITGTALQILGSVKQVRENYLGADRSEMSATMQYAQSQLEKSGREQYGALSQEQEAVRNYEARRNKREDFMLQMARN